MREKTREAARGGQGGEKCGLASAIGFSRADCIIYRRAPGHGTIAGSERRIAGATASVSSNNATAGIVWVLDGAGGALYAYDATNLATKLYDTSQASGGRDTPGQPVKFAVPTVAHGHVYVGTQTELDVYGLLP